ncbi:TetR/AcrR family transcriptional regulator [Shinella sp. BYT-45]|uniref:TetR/AcrR family transcriptional regulator n=1 Tax=Shinella sp. BYT-45 TaxID=3377377 RepID=UPI00397FA6AF
MPELRRVYTTVDARDRILEAALTVFSDVGFAGATMRAIADAAEVSSGLIHHHFKDKESLWKLVGERISAEFQEAVSVGTELDDPALSLRRAIENYQRYWREHPRALRFQLWRVLGAPIEERKARSKLLNQHFVPKFTTAQEAGIVRNDIPAGLAMVTAGGLIQYFLHSDIETEDAIAVTGDAPLDDDQVLDYLLGLIAPARATGKKDTP